VSTYCGAFVSEIACPTDEGSKITYAAKVELFAADIVLSQPAPPSVSAVGGGLAENPSVAGTSDIAFHASDSPSGLYEAIFTVDGTVAGRVILNEEGDRCRNVGETTDGLLAFLSPRPCPPELSVDLPFDTSHIANGPHHLLVTVTDAAGNASVVLDRTITVANPSPAGNGPGGGAPRGPLNGAGVSSEAAEHAVLSAAWKPPRGAHGARSARLRTRFGARRTIEGSLKGPEGRPISSAVVEVASLPAAAGASLRALSSVHTDAAGRFSLALPRGLPSCELLLAYRGHVGDSLPTATRALTLVVPAAPRLGIAPRTASSQGTIRLSGTLLGGPIPPGGKALVLEARAPRGRWLEFHVVRTSTRGRFSFVYRFRLPGPRAISSGSSAKRRPTIPMRLGRRTSWGFLRGEGRGRPTPGRPFPRARHGPAGR